MQRPLWVRSYYRRQMPIRLSGACQACLRTLPGRDQSRWQRSGPSASGWAERSTTCCSRPWLEHFCATWRFGRTSRTTRSLRAIIPINVRPPGAEPELGNRITAVFLPLPVDTADPTVRLAGVEAEDGRTQRLTATGADPRGPGGRQPGSIAGVHLGARLHELQGDRHRDKRERATGAALPGWRCLSRS